MRQKWIIQDVLTGNAFTGSDLNGIYFSKGSYPIRYFDSKEQADERLKEEYYLFPSQFSELNLTIIEVYTLNY